MSYANPNCDGDHCRKPGEVRLYPLGGGGNLILCRQCFTEENAFRLSQQRKHYRDAASWPLVDWTTAEHYATDDRDGRLTEPDDAY